MSDPAWYDDVGVLYAKYDDFFPRPDHSDAERLNAFVRLMAYASLAAFLVRFDVKYLVIGTIVSAVATLAFKNSTMYMARPEPFANVRPSTVQKNKQRCTRSTPENPYSNMTIGTLISDPTRAPACSYDDPSVAADIRSNFNRGLYRNLEDVYEVENSQRQFYTMPVTTSAPDTIAFAEFLYGSRGKTCKELPEKCEPAFATRT